MKRILLSFLAGLFLCTPAIANTPEAGGVIGFNSLSWGGMSVSGFGLALRGGLRMKGGLTPEGMLVYHGAGGGNQVVLGGGARYYFLPKKEDIQPFALAHLQLQTKSPSALGLAIGGGAQYRIDKQFFAEGLTTYHLSLGDAFNIFFIGVGGGMKF
jgi:hypothetical protein